MKLTVLIPIYNTKPHHLLESILSILQQDDGTKNEILLIDDCSTDPFTIAAIELAKTLSDTISCIKLDKNSGTSVALNKGHEYVNTEFVAIMGSDDISHPSRFRLQLKYLAEHPETDVLGTNLFSFRADDITRKPIFTSSHPENPDAAKNWLVNHGTVIYRQQAVLDVGGYDPAYRRAQDVELWKRMKNKYVFRNVGEVLYGWRRY